jgi:hypothetical protein
VSRLGLPLIAGLLVVAVLGVEIAAGGGRYAPRRPANPCVSRQVAPIRPQLEPLAEKIVLLGLDSAACRLGISRERLVLAPLGGPKVRVRVKFLDGRTGWWDGARYPFEGQPQSGFRRAECPHLVDIRRALRRSAKWGGASGL